jgi:hypothetical protein
LFIANSRKSRRIEIGAILARRQPAQRMALRQLRAPARSAANIPNPESLRIIRQEHAFAVRHASVVMADTGPAQAVFRCAARDAVLSSRIPRRAVPPQRSDLLFPTLSKKSCTLIRACAEAIQRLDAHHRRGDPGRVSTCCKPGNTWAIRGAMLHGRLQALHPFLPQPPHAEEDIILPSAQKHLSAQDWQGLDDSFAANRNPSGHHRADSAHDQLFTRIVMRALSPIGLGS